MPVPIVICNYDPRWPLEYAKEKERVMAAIGQYVLAMEHIGSTSVPGLASKPIIDLAAGVRQFSDTDLCIQPLRKIGYVYVPEFERELPGRRYFYLAAGEEHTHHLHMVEITSEFWKRHIFFREYLRAHPEQAQAYVQLKRELAARYGTDRPSYTSAKAEFIRHILTLAEEELHGKLDVMPS